MATVMMIFRLIGWGLDSSSMAPPPYYHYFHTDGEFNYYRMETDLNDFPEGFLMYCRGYIIRSVFKDRAEAENTGDIVWINGEFID